MTKLEQKLKELGYVEDTENNLHYFKNIILYWEYCINLYLTEDKLKIRLCFLHNDNKHIYNTKNINDIAQAFNEMQKDLEVLKQCQ